MTGPLANMAPELAERQAQLASDLLATGLVFDPYGQGALRFDDRPRVLAAGRYAELCQVAELVTLAYDAAVQLCVAQPKLLTQFLGLTPCQKLMWQASAPHWHGFARADVFETNAGLLITELNCDTPTGHPEAVVLGARAAASAPGLSDPNSELAARMLGLATAMATARLGQDHERTVGLVYPTDQTEDLALVRLYERWFAGAGYRTVQGSPYNITLGESGHACLMGVPCGIIMRHYKTDWWSERTPAWKGDAPFDDPYPLAAQLEVLGRAELAGRTVTINPMGAVVAQNKRIMALLWEHIDEFSADIQHIVRAHIPETLRLESMHRAQLSAEREQWVLKSDYGAESDEVLVGTERTQAEWDHALALCEEGRFVVQRRFHEIAHEDDPGLSRNYGVFVVAGRAAGAYLRTSRGSTDRAALSVPLLVRPAQGVDR
jgi:glutathionylspermidine synthase